MKARQRENNNPDTVSAEGHNPPLLEAISMCQIDDALLILADGADPNASGFITGYTPLMASSRGCFQGLTRALIKAGAKVNVQDSWGKTALHYAASNPDCRKDGVIKILLDAGASTDVPDKLGFLPADYLLKSIQNNGHGSDVLSLDTYHLGFLKISSGGNTDLLETVAFNRIPWRIINDTLVGCSSDGNNDYVKLLLHKGADANGFGMSGERPLVAAAAMLQLKTALLLIENGAQIDGQNNLQQSPLLAACQYASSFLPDDTRSDVPGIRHELARFLLEKGADVNCRSYLCGHSPLRQAVFASQDIALAKLLLEYGADPHTKDGAGESPLDLAKQHCSQEMVDLLQDEDWGRNINA